MDSFVFYESFQKGIDMLPEEEQLKAYKMLVAYALRGEEPTEQSLANIVLEMAKPNIDANAKRRKDGSKGGRPSKTDGLEEEKPVVSEEKTSGFESENHRLADEKPNEDENEDENVNEDVNENTISRKPVARECDFDDLWNLYPKKQGRREAFEAFKRAIRDGDTVDEIRQGIRNYSAFIIQNKTEPRYVKQGSTYFRQRAWKDKYDLPMASGFDYDMRTDDMSDVLMEL